MISRNCFVYSESLEITLQKRIETVNFFSSLLRGKNCWYLSCHSTVLYFMYRLRAHSPHVAADVFSAIKRYLTDGPIYNYVSVKMTGFFLANQKIRNGVVSKSIRVVTLRTPVNVISVFEHVLYYQKHKSYVKLHISFLVTCKHTRYPSFEFQLQYLRIYIICFYHFCILL